MCMTTSLTHYDSSSLSSTALALLEEASETTDTRKQYESHYRIFRRWLDHKGVLGAPSHIDLINFMADQFSGALVKYDTNQKTLVDDDPIAATTIDARRWGILKILNAKGIRFSQEQHEAISEYVRRLKLTSANQATSRRRGQAAPLRWPSVEKLINSPRMNGTSYFQTLRDKALLCFMAISGCRESEACGKYGVRVKDFFIFSDRIDYFRVILKGGNRSYNFRGSIANDDNAAVSPYRLIREYVEYVRSLEGVDPETKLFLRSNSNGEPMRERSDSRKLMPMGASSIDEKLKDWAFSAGLPAEALEQVSGHSLRIGLAVDQVELGRTFEYISKITGQTVATVERYAQQAQMDPFNINQRED